MIHSWVTEQHKLTWWYKNFRVCFPCDNKGSMNICHSHVISYLEIHEFKTPRQKRKLRRLGKFQYNNSVSTHRKLHLGNGIRCLIRFHKRFWSLLLQSFSLTGISISFNLLYTIPINTYICFMSFTDTVSYSNTHFMDFPSPLANNNILFLIPSAFPSLGFILALPNCT